jgi:PAS domain S-box-containing protein
MIMSTLDRKRKPQFPVSKGSTPIWGPSERDELLRLAIQVGGIGIFETDFEQDRSRFSPELCAILGLPVGTEMTYGEATSLYHGPDRAAAIARAEAALYAPEKGRWSSVHRIMRPDGTVRWISVQGRRIYQDTPEGPKAVRSIGTVIDITHIKEAEEALRENERRLRLALDAARMGTFEVDLAGTQAFIDAQEASLLGLPEETRLVSVEDLRERVPLEDLRASDAKRKRLTEENEAYHHEFRVRLPDGKERWLSAYADIRSDHIFGVNFDVTERRRAEAALRESEARLRIATNGAALGIFEWDPLTDHVVWENDRIYEIFGRTRNDSPISKQQFVSEHLHPDDVGRFETALSNAIRTSGAFHIACRIKWKDGSHRWLQIDAKLETLEGGERRRLVGVVGDITKRKVLEQEAKDLSERLINLQEEERQRISQELHDSTAQHLVAASLQLMTIRATAEQGGETTRMWEDIKTSIQEALREIRTFSYLMHPPALRSDGLTSTVRRYLDGFADRSGLSVTFRSNAAVDELPFAQQRALFRIVQEALANVHRHARASRVAVDLRTIAGRTHLIVNDNGHGVAGVLEEDNRTDGHMHFPCANPGVGILGIRARARQFGGDLRIATGQNGTRLHVVTPQPEGDTTISHRVHS